MSDMKPELFLDDVLGAPASLRALADAYPDGPGGASRAVGCCSWGWARRGLPR